MTLQGQSLLSLKGYGEWGKFLRSRTEQMRVLPQRRTWGTTRQSASPQSPVR